MKTGSIAAVAAAAMATMLPSALLAQTTDKERSRQDIATWSQAMRSALPGGYWEGTFEELDLNGKVVSTETKPDCMTNGQFNKVSANLEQVFVRTLDLADCTTTGGGPGSLNLDMACTRSDGGTMRFVSAGTYGKNAVDWNIQFTLTGDGKTEGGGMRLNARRLRETC